MAYAIIVADNYHYMDKVSAIKAQLLNRLIWRWPHARALLIPIWNRRLRMVYRLAVSIRVIKCSEKILLSLPKTDRHQCISAHGIMQKSGANYF